MSPKEKDPNILSINVSEDIKSTEVPPGTPKKTIKEHMEALPPEEVEKRQKIMSEYTRLQGRYCEPHNIPSKWVKSIDLEKVMADGKDLVALCNLPRGKYSGISALTHSQIDNKNPLRFFVLTNGMVIINPIIFSHTKVTVDKQECCMSHCDELIKEKIPRYNKISVMYQTLAKGEKGEIVLSKPVTEQLSGGQAHMFEHKVGHLNSKNWDIYAEGFEPESCLFLGNGIMSEDEIKNMYEDIEEAKITIKE